MATATVSRRREPSTATIDTSEKHFDDEGFEIRYEIVNGEETPFSLKPYPDAERPLYWNPCGPYEMDFRSRYFNERGIRPKIQTVGWILGKFSPRNPWEEFKTREWMKQSINGCGNPDDWKGTDHPEGPGHEFYCGTCTWHCGNWRAFKQHCRHLSHRQSLDL